MYVYFSARCCNNCNSNCLCILVTVCVFQQQTVCFSNFFPDAETRVTTTICWCWNTKSVLKTEYGVFSYSRTVVLKKFVIFFVIFMVNTNRTFLHIFLSRFLSFLYVELRNFASSVLFEIIRNSPTAITRKRHPLSAKKSQALFASSRLGLFKFCKFDFR